jgi:hypothetical protein
MAWHRPSFDSHPREVRIMQLKKVQFAFISPFAYLDLIPKSANFHLLLAHLLINKQYVDFYNARHKAGDFIVLDNGAFEFKHPLSAEEILRLIEESGIEIDCVVAPDFPGRRGIETISATEQFIHELQRREVKIPFIMAVPQSEKGDYLDWVSCYQRLCNINEVTHIGMSILGIPNAFSSLTGTSDITFNRVFASQFLLKEGSVSKKVWHHYLGLGLPREILLQRMIGIIDSNDSSSPFWHGCWDVWFDSSYGALKGGKIETAVDFSLKPRDVEEGEEKRIEAIQWNIAYMETLCHGSSVCMKSINDPK